MPGKLLEEFVIPARYGRGFVVEKGQVFRIAQVEGGQVGDCAFYNADDPKEMFHCGQSWAINVTAGTGTSKAFKYFYSKPPRENVMLTVLEDTLSQSLGQYGRALLDPALRKSATISRPAATGRARKTCARPSSRSA